MKKRTNMQATDPVVSRKVAISLNRDRGGSSAFNAGVKTLSAVTAVTAVISVFVPAVLGITIFTGLLTVIAFVAAFMPAVKFDSAYSAKDYPFDMSVNHHELSPSYFGGPFMADRMRTNLDIDI